MNVNSCGIDAKYKDNYFLVLSDSLNYFKIWSLKNQKWYKLWLGIYSRIKFTDYNWKDIYFIQGRHFKRNKYHSMLG